VKSRFQHRYYSRPAKQMWTLYFHPVISTILFLLSFYLLSSPNLSRRRLDVYHTSTHDVALVRFWNAGLKRAACDSLIIQDAKIAKNSTSGHHRTTLLGHIFATKARIDNRKKTCQTAISPPDVLTIWRTSPYWQLRSVYMFGAPRQISTCFASWLRYCSDVAHRRPTKRTIFSRLLRWMELRNFQQGGHHVKHRPTFKLLLVFGYSCSCWCISVFDVIHRSRNFAVSIRFLYRKQLNKSVTQ